MTDTMLTIAVCYAAVGGFVWCCGLCGDDWRLDSWRAAVRLLASLAAVVVGWPWIVWLAVRSYLGR